MICDYKHPKLFTHPISKEWSRDEVTYFYVGDVFCIYLSTKYANFQEKICAEISEKPFKLYYKEKFGAFSQKSPPKFFLENCHKKA